MLADRHHRNATSPLKNKRRKEARDLGLEKAELPSPRGKRGRGRGGGAGLKGETQTRRVPVAMEKGMCSDICSLFLAPHSRLCSGACGGKKMLLFLSL